MPNYKIARLIRSAAHFKCEMCGKTSLTKMYEYQSTTLIPRYTTKHYKKICANCIYKTVYGSIKWKEEKREGSLDR